jgi:cephalosporin-C deacetylase-like acetyl esterase
MIENYKLLKLYRDSNILSEDLAKFEKFGFITKYLPEPKFYNIGGVTTKCYQIKDIVFGLDPKDETKIIIYKKIEKK